MNQMAISFVDTRSRRTDADTSKEAAKHAASAKSALQRIAIRKALLHVYPRGLTAKELAQATGIPYDDVKRRVSESGGTRRETERRDGCAAWVASF
jgi:DNA-directed RNA polymerase specialized sigma24 family protein